MKILEKTKVKTLTPFLKYAGGKTWLAPRLAEMYEPFRNTHIWVEPFCGALGAALGVMPEYALLNDVNPHLINLYRQVKDNFNGFGIDTNLQYATTENSYYRLRERFNNLRSMTSYAEVQAEQAELFYYLNRVGYRGLCRTNLDGVFNVPFGHYKKPILNHDFTQYQKAFENWKFFNKSWDRFDWYRDIENLFAYVDPPYDDGFVGYSGSFTWDDQVNLASSLATLNCPVVASNKATDRIFWLYTKLGFDVEIVSAPRRISCNGNRGNVDEILATRNLKA